MPIAFTNRPINQVMDQLPDPRPGAFKQDDNHVVIVNPLANSILPGEPIPYGNSIVFSPKVIYPGQAMGCKVGARMEVRVDTGLAAAIGQGDKVYWDYDITIDSFDGAATNVEPTNGYFLGYAEVYNEATPYVPDEVESEVAASTSAETVLVFCPPGAAKKYGTTPWDGEDLEQHLIPDGGTIAVAGATLAIPVTHRFASKTTGGVEALTLADGSPGQLLTITLAVDGGDGTLTPATSTGWATIVFADAGDTATLQYIDDTIGWIVVGLAGATAPPAMTI